MIIQASSAIVSGELVGDTWVEVTSGVIRSVNAGVNPAADKRVNGCLIPGFVDIHCHGGGSGNFTSLDSDSIQVAIDTHRRHGTTSLMASLVSESIDTLKEQVLRLKPFFDAGKIIGIHLEGPYLSHARCGAHDPSVLVDPNVAQLKELVEISEGAIKMVTLAPELPGAIEAIEYLTSVGIRSALGHTSGTYQDGVKGTRAGASIITHFFNAMDKSLESDSFASFSMQENDIFVELILDGFHIPFPKAKEIYSVLGQRAVLVTDAMAAAGSSDGSYVIGKLPVRVAEGVARLESTQALAGSTLTMDNAFTNSIEFLGLSIAEAVEATSTRAATSMGLHDRGKIAVGMRADLLGFDERDMKISLVNVSE